MKIKSIVRRFDANSADKKKQEVERRYLAVFSISDHSCFSILMLEKKITSTRCAPIFLDSLSLRRIVRRTVDRLDRKVVGIDIEIGTNGVEVLKKKNRFSKVCSPGRRNVLRGRLRDEAKSWSFDWNYNNSTFHKVRANCIYGLRSCTKEACKQSK